jgi:hypothetical protein
LVHCNGADESTTFTDVSASGHTVTANVTAQVDTVIKKFGTGSCLFDGDSDFLSVADHADWNFGTGALTIEGWVYFLSGFGPTTGNNGVFCQYDDTSNYFMLDMWTVDDVTENIAVQFAAEGGGDTVTATAQSTSWGVGEDQWIHVAVIRGWGGNANDWAVCLNGTAVATDTQSITMPDLAADLWVGKRNYNVTTYYTDGHIDEFRVSKGIARWTSNFKVPTGEYKNLSP